METYYIQLPGFASWGLIATLPVVTKMIRTMLAVLINGPRFDALVRGEVK